MQTHSAKQQALEAIEQLPDNVPMDEIVYRLYVLNKAHQGLDDADAGRVVSSEALAAEIEQW
jgi:predicted transcriptional regulator